MIKIVIYMISLFFMPCSDVISEDNTNHQKDPNSKWHIKADQITYDKGICDAFGNVTISQPMRTIHADTVRFDRIQNTISAKGNVTLSINDDTVTGERVDIDLTKNTGTIYNGTVFFQNTHFYIRSDLISKTGDDTYMMDNAGITSCDNDSDGWKITGKQINITLDGYGTIRNTTFWIKDIPCLYIPYAIFPVKLTRQSGLLLPFAEYSNQKGFFYQQPLYWAINPNSDATLYQGYMAKRGLMQGLEYRYMLSSRSKGTAMFNWLKDRQYNPYDDNSYDSASYENDNTLYEKNRYWFVMKHDTQLPFDTHGLIDLDIASDPDFLDDFRTGYTGFDKTRNYFYDKFKREPQEPEEIFRRNRLHIDKQFAQSGLNMDLSWYDTLTEQKPIQYFPLLRYDIMKHNLWHSSLFWQLNSQYSYMYKEDENSSPDGYSNTFTATAENPNDMKIKIHRANIYPRLFMPIRFGYGVFEPSIGFNRTVWLTTEQNNFSRSVYDVQGVLSSEIFKVYSVGYKGASLKHSIVPKVEYLYIPDINQDNLKRYNGKLLDDIIEPQNLLSCSLSNEINLRTIRINPKTGNFAYEYPLYGKFKLSRLFDMNPEKKQVQALKGELELESSYVKLSADSSWDSDKKKFDSGNVVVSLSDIKGDSLKVRHSYMADHSETLKIELALNLLDKVGVYSSYEHDLFSKNRINTIFGINYQAQCIGVDIRYQNDAINDDQSIMAMLHLRGLGNVGDYDK